MKVNFEALFNRKTFFIDAFLLLLSEEGKRNLVRDSSHMFKNKQILIKRAHLMHTHFRMQ